jgi:glycosyltransferase involved in cell wall biosynthesis
MFEIDVIIPFHRPIDRFLMSAIESVESSLNVSVHLILINDRESNRNSTIELRKKGFSVIQSNNKGYAECLNIGIKHSNSEYIGILNSDDLQSPQRLSKQISLMKAEGTSMSICRLRKFARKRRIFELSGSQLKGKFHKLQLLLGAYGANASLVQVRDSNKGNLFSDVVMSDWEYAFKFYPENVSLLDEELYWYRMHPNQITRRKQESPNWLFSEWSSLFATISAQKVPNKVIDACCRPNMLTRIESSEIQLFLYTLNEIKSNLMAISQVNEIEVNELILRRYIFATWRTQQSKRYFLGSLDLSQKQLIHTQSRLLFEILFNTKFTRKL